MFSNQTPQGGTQGGAQGGTQGVLLTPFSRQLKENQEKRKQQELSLMNQTSASQGSVAGLMSSQEQELSLFKSLKPAQSFEPKILANKTQAQAKFDASKAQIQGIAAELKNKVQRNELSYSEAATQLQAFVDDISESQYPGFNEVVSKTKAKEVSKVYNIPEDKALDMIKKGYDPEKIQRAQSMTGAIGAMQGAMQSAMQDPMQGLNGLQPELQPEQGGFYE